MWAKKEIKATETNFATLKNGSCGLPLSTPMGKSTIVCINKAWKQ